MAGARRLRPSITTQKPWVVLLLASRRPSRTWTGLRSGVARPNSEELQAISPYFHTSWNEQLEPSMDQLGSSSISSSYLTAQLIWCAPPWNPAFYGSPQLSRCSRWPGGPLSFRCRAGRLRPSVCNLRACSSCLISWMSRWLKPISTWRKTRVNLQRMLVQYPRLDAWRQQRALLDPRGVFSSDLACAQLW